MDIYEASFSLAEIMGLRTSIDRIRHRINVFKNLVNIIRNYSDSGFQDSYINLIITKSFEESTQATISIYTSSRLLESLILALQ
jgi:hypothetical protein